LGTLSLIEEQSQYILDNIRDIIFILSSDGKIKSMTKEFEKLTGWSREKWIEKHFLEMVHPDDTAVVVEGFQATLEGETVPPYETRIFTKSGEIITLETKLTPQIVNGKVSGYLGIARDVTERKNAEESSRTSENQYRMIINSMGDAIHVINSDLRIILTNAAFSTWLNQLNLKTDLVGRTVQEAFPFLPDHVLVEYDDVFSSGRTLVTEESTTIDGKIFYTETRKIPIFRGKTVVQVLTIIRDVTQRTRIEKQLRQREKKQRELISNLTDVVVEMDLEGKFIFISSQAFDLFGYNPEDVLGKNSFDFIHPDDIESAQNVLMESLAGKRIFDFEYRIKHKNGHYMWVAASGKVIEYGDNSKIVCGIKNLTDRILAEEKLRESEERLLSFMNEATDSFTLWDSELNLVDCNKMTLQMFPAETKKQNVLGRNMQEFVTDPANIKPYKIVLRTGIPFSGDRVAPSKLFKDLHLFVKAFKVGEGLGIIITDITERKRAEDELRKTKFRLEYLLKSCPAVIYSCTPGDQFSTTFMSENIKEILGYQTSNFINTPEFWERKIHPDDKEKVSTAFTEILEQGNYSDAYRFKHKKGSYRWMLDEANLIKDEKGNPLEIVGFWTDITDYKKTEEALRESEEKFRSIFENSPIGKALADLNFRITEVNEVFKEMLGYKENELYQKTILDLTHEEFHKQDEKQIRRLLNGKISSFQTEKRYLRKNQEPLWVQVTMSLLKDDKGDPQNFFLMAEDISAIKHREEELKKQFLKYNIEDGNVYLVTEEFLSLSKTVFYDLINIGYKGTIASRTPSKDFRKFMEGDYNFFWLTERNGYRKLITLIEELPNKSVMLIDRLEYLFLKEGFNNAIQFIFNLKELTYLKNLIIILSIDSVTISERELRVLEKETQEIKPRFMAKIAEELLEILRYVFQQNNLGLKPSYSDIGEGLKISRPTIRKRVKRLKAAGYLLEDKKGKSKVVEISGKGRMLFLG
jgi:PAS domain S-box-containing protein